MKYFLERTALVSIQVQEYTGDYQLLIPEINIVIP